MAPGDNTTPRRRHRSAVACQACRQRKVRCSITVTGIPCAGCAQDRTECIVHPTTKAGRRNRQSTASHLPPSSPNPSGMSHTPSPAADPGPVRERSGVHERQAANNVQNEERSGFEIATAALGQSRGSGNVPYYSGKVRNLALDKTLSDPLLGSHIGPISTLNACSNDQTLSSHFFLPSHVSATLSDASRTYLQENGVFSLPGSDTCDSLLSAYFHHVHPIMPVIEADVILTYCNAGRLHEYNILLLWCIFFIGANVRKPPSPTPIFN